MHGHLAEANKDVLGDLVEDAHVHNGRVRLAVDASRQHIALPKQPQSVPLHCRACQHGQHAHQQPVACAPVAEHIDEIAGIDDESKLDQCAKLTNK